MTFILGLRVLAALICIGSTWYYYWKDDVQKAIFWVVWIIVLETGRRYER